LLQAQFFFLSLLFFFLSFKGILDFLLFLKCFFDLEFRLTSDFFVIIQSYGSSGLTVLSAALGFFFFPLASADSGFVSSFKIKIQFLRKLVENR
jgi:hypothetical protein